MFFILNESRMTFLVCTVTHGAHASNDFAKLLPDKQNSQHLAKQIKPTKLHKRQCTIISECVKCLLKDLIIY